MEMEHPTQTPPILARKLKRGKRKRAPPPRSDQDGARMMNLVQDSDANVDAWNLVAATHPDSRRFAWIGFGRERAPAHDWATASVLPLQLQELLLVSSSKRRAAGMHRSRGARGLWVLPLHLGWTVRLLKENSGPTKPSWARGTEKRRLAAPCV